jgi:hypothetical protein
MIRQNVEKTKNQLNRFNHMDEFTEEGFHRGGLIEPEPISRAVPRK